MIEEDRSISLAYLHQVKWSGREVVAVLMPWEDGLLIDGKVMLTATKSIKRTLTVHLTRPEGWFVALEGQLEKGWERKEHPWAGDIGTVSIGMGSSPGRARAFIEDKYRLTYKGMGPEGLVMLGVEARGLVQVRYTQGMKHTEANQHLRMIMASP